MKNFSLAMLTFGVASALTAATMWKKAEVDGHLALKAAEVVEQAVAFRETVERDTVWVTAYRTRYIYLSAQRKVPDAYFNDTSSVSLPSDLGTVQGTRFQDTLSVIALADYIKAPKSFVFTDSNVYLSATVLATGIKIDSLSVDAKISFSPVWRGNVARVSILSVNPYITGLSPVVLVAKRAWLLK